MPSLGVYIWFIVKFYENWFLNGVNSSPFNAHWFWPKSQAFKCWVLSAVHSPQPSHHHLYFLKWASQRPLCRLSDLREGKSRNHRSSTGGQTSSLVLPWEPVLSIHISTPRRPCLGGSRCGKKWSTLAVGISEHQRVWTQVSRKDQWSMLNAEQGGCTFIMPVSQRL